MHKQNNNFKIITLLEINSSVLTVSNLSKLSPLSKSSHNLPASTISTRVANSTSCTTYWMAKIALSIPTITFTLRRRLSLCMILLMSNNFYMYPLFMLAVCPVTCMMVEALDREKTLGLGRTRNIFNSF